MTELSLGLFNDGHFRLLSRNLDCDDIVKHPELPWIRGDLSANRTMTLEHWDAFNEGKYDPTLAAQHERYAPRTTPGKFVKMEGWWSFGALMCTFGTKGRRDVFPMPYGSKMRRTRINLESIAHLDWFEAKYPDNLCDAWHAYTGMGVGFTISDLDELYKRGMIKIDAYRHLLTTHPDITLMIIERSGGVHSFQNLLRYLPLADMPRLFQKYKSRSYIRNNNDVFSRQETTKEWFELWLGRSLLYDETKKQHVLCTDTNPVFDIVNCTLYNMMLTTVVSFISLDSLLQWDNTDRFASLTVGERSDRTAWSRHAASSNKNLPVGWLFEIFDKWPRVYGDFDVRRLVERTSLLDYVVHLRGLDVAKSYDDQIKSIFARSTRFELYAGVIAAQRRGDLFLPTIDQLVEVSGITLDDFYFFYPRARPLSSRRVLLQTSFSDLNITAL
jgi:hypothetical protein